VGSRLRVGAPSSSFDDVRAEFQLPSTYPAEAVPAPTSSPRRDRRDLELLTIDPPGSQDLDQAVHIERRGEGWRVHYAIADVAAFVGPGSALDEESRRRAVTVYLPDGRVPLYPPAMGEGAASLLPGVERPAVLWTIDLAADGEAERWTVERATVRSRSQLDYAGAQDAIDAGDGPETLRLLADVGAARERIERQRGGVSLNLPEQEVVGADLRFRAGLPIEGWNAQISLLTGFCVARDLLDAGAPGLLRTLPPPDERTIARLRRTTKALGIAWPRRARYAQVVHGLDPSNDAHLAFLTQAARLFRGAGYAVLPVAPGEAEPVHAALAAPYAHVTAPLRRLADRFVHEIVLALADDREPPEQVVSALEGVAERMAAANRLEAAVDRACVDAMECDVLAGRVGDTFDAVVVDRRKDDLIVQLRSPAVVARASGAAKLGSTVSVRLETVDRASRQVRFSVR
jgi:exoribonuclease R